MPHVGVSCVSYLYLDRGFALLNAIANYIIYYTELYQLVSWANLIHDVLNLERSDNVGHKLEEKKKLKDAVKRFSADFQIAKDKKNKTSKFGYH
jgi:hypothetical protein